METVVSDMGDGSPTDGPSEVYHADFFNPKQRAMFDIIVLNVRKGQETIILLTGGLGTRKTFTSSNIFNSVGAIRIRYVATAFMSAAVFQLEVICTRMSLNLLIQFIPTSDIVKQFVTPRCMLRSTGFFR